MTVAACPPPVDLERLFLGGLPEPEAEALERHVLECGACLTTLRGLLGAKDTLSGILGGTTKSDAFSAAPVLAGLVTKIKSLRSASARPSSSGIPMIIISCSSCQKKLSVKEETIGKKVKCPACGQVTVVPAPVTIGAEREPRTIPPAIHVDAPTVAPTDVGDKPTHPPSAKPDATVGVKPDDGHDSGLTDFLAPPRADDELGRLGKYRILKILGHGGMGVVYKAEDPKLERTVAIKAMLPILAVSASCGDRFTREAKAMAAVEHDHIVRIYEINEDRGVPFLAMEFLKGEPLDERLKRAEPIPLAEVLRIGREVAEGLGAAHATGLIHRDIKPGNIWLEARGERRELRAEKTETVESLLAPHHSVLPPRVKILDFGLARAASQETGLTQQGAIIGTPAYMAPEQGRGAAVDARCDLFSLGVILYRMCTGVQPFHGTDTVSTIMAVATEAPAAPILVNPEVPCELSDLVMHLLEKKPDQRVATAGDVVHALQAIERKLAAGPSADGRTEAFTVAPPRPSAGRADQPDSEAPTQSLVLKPRRSRAFSVVAAVFAALTLVAAAIIFYWQTNNGVVRIEINDADIQFKVDKAGATFTGTKTQEITVSPGEHGLHVKRGPDLEFDTKKFILKKGETITLKIEWLPEGKLLVKQGNNVLGETSAPPAVVDSLPARFTNSLGMEFALVPKGKGWLGGGGGIVGDEEVEFKRDFYLGVHEVTQGDWEKVMQKSPSSFNPTGEDKGAVQAIPEADLKRFPVEGISWDDAQVFLQRLNETAKDNGWIYRLPSEAEWEYACRGGPLAKKEDYGFNYYVEAPKNILSREKANVAASGLNRPRKVGSYPPNALGLCDMHGNVWEMCGDVVDGLPRRAFRGGSWRNDGLNNATERVGLVPTFRTNDLGLRVARVPAGAAPISLPPLDDAWFKLVAAMPGAKQVEAVKAKLMERNQGFNGKVKPEFEDDVVVELEFLSDNVTDLSPVRALTGLRHLNCAGMEGDRRAPLADLTPLQDLKLTILHCGYTHVADLTPLKNMKLVHFTCTHTLVSDLTPLKDMPLTLLGCETTLVADLTPLKGMPLQHLWCGNTKVSEVAPLKDMPLKSLTLFGTPVSELTPLKNLKLTGLHIAGTRVTDLTPLQDMPLTMLDCDGTKVADLAPLKNAKLTELHCCGTQVTDLAPLKNMRLTYLDIGETQVADLTPLQGAPLATLLCNDTKAIDLAPLRGMPLKDLGCDFKPERDTEIVRSIKTLEKINGKSAVEFWKDVSAAPGFETWLKEVAALPAAEQVEAVKAKLMERNPGFDGKLGRKINKNGVVIELTFLSDKVVDISPLRALVGLQTLHCNASYPGKSKLADLSPLKDLRLKTLRCFYTKVSDLTPLQDMKLTKLTCFHTPVSDLTPLKNMKLAELDFHNTKVADLTPLRGMPLTKLNCAATKVTDLAPLTGMPLREFRCTFKAERDAEIVRSIKTLAKINDKDAADFWKEH